MTAAAVAGPSLPRWLADEVLGMVARAYEAGRLDERASSSHPPAAAHGGGRAPDTVLTRAEAAATLRCGLGKLNLLVKTGQLPSFRIGGRRYVRRADIDTFLADLARDRPWT